MWRFHTNVIANGVAQPHPNFFAKGVIQSHSGVIARNGVTWQSHKKMHFPQEIAAQARNDTKLKSRFFS